jgi:hypothetical protein
MIIEYPFRLGEAPLPLRETFVAAEHGTFPPHLRLIKHASKKRHYCASAVIR